MLEIRKHYVLDENQHPIAVQIAIADFEQSASLRLMLWHTIDRFRVYVEFRDA